MKFRFSHSVVAVCAVLAACTHAPPPAAPVLPPVATIPIPKPAPVDHSIGTATMLTDRSIQLDLRTSLDGGPGHMTQTVKPTDQQYAQVLKRIGGLKPGQTKPITEYPLQ